MSNDERMVARRGAVLVAVAMTWAAGVAGCGGDTAQWGGEEVCSPGDARCAGAQVLECNAAGTGWLVGEVCDAACVDGLCVDDCTPDCAGRECGDDGCGGSCGACPGALDECVDGQCQCQPDCAGKECGDDGCGGVCGECDAEYSYCGDAQVCEPCETAVCGVCDELDVSSIVAYIGPIGEDHAVDQLRAEVLEEWPITTELEVTFDQASPGFILHHFDGEYWNPTSAENYTDGAVMVACWDSVSYGGVICQSWEWYTPDVGGIYRSFDWPAGKPVAHVLISAIDEKRTAIEYFDSWPYNNVGGGFDGNDVTANLVERPCH